MNNYKLFDVLSTFDKKEFRKYGELVASPFFNKNKKVIKLFSCIEPYYPDFGHKNFTPELIFAKAFPGEKFSHGSFKNLISDLYALAEEFLSIAGFNKKEFEKEFSLLSEFRHRELFSIYESSYKKMISQLEHRSIKDEDYFYDKHMLISDCMWYTPINKPNTSLENHQAYLDSVVSYSLIKFVKSYSLMMHEQNQTNIEYNLTMLDEVLAYLGRQKIENPTLLIYYKITQLLKTKDLSTYLELKELKEKYFDELHIYTRRRLFIHLYDFCAYMVNFKEEDSYNKDMFEIYKEVLARKFMTADNLLYSDFMNIVKIACRVNEFGFASDFIENYSSSIPNDEKYNVLEFCHGVINYASGKYREALQNFSRTNFQNFIHKVQVKLFLLQSFYKNEMFEEVLGMIDTFQHYILKEKSLLSEHTISYKLYLKLVKELILSLSITDKKEMEYRIHKIKKEAETMPANPFRIKTWIKEELNSLK